MLDTFGSACNSYLSRIGHLQGDSLKNGRDGYLRDDFYNSRLLELFAPQHVIGADVFSARFHVCCRIGSHMTCTLAIIGAAVVAGMGGFVLGLVLS